MKYQKPQHEQCLESCEISALLYPPKNGPREGVMCSLPTTQSAKSMKMDRCFLFQLEMEVCMQATHLPGMIGVLKTVQSKEFVRDAAGHRIDKWSIYQHFIWKYEPRLTEWNKGADE